MTTFVHTHPVARKAHRCDVCWRTIEPGERYTRGFGLDSGAGAWTYRYCAHCAIVTRYVADRCAAEEFDPRDLLEDWEPDAETECLVREALLVHRWRTPAGALLPVPEVLHTDARHPYRPTDIHLPEETAA